MAISCPPQEAESKRRKIQTTIGGGRIPVVVAYARGFRYNVLTRKVLVFWKRETCTATWGIDSTLMVLFDTQTLPW